MSNDNKTLADAQPGGRARLGDQAERAQFEVWVKNHVSSLARAADGEYASNFTHALWSAWRAALSAQPSPGGQDHRILELARRNIRAYIQIASFPTEADRSAAGLCVDVLEEALAARQPVREPVLRDRPTHNVYRGSCGLLPCLCWADEDHILGDEVKRYAAPPAQAVDLGPVRDVFRRWHANELNSTDAMLALVEALAVIDSQAVGK